MLSNAASSETDTVVNVGKSTSTEQVIEILSPNSTGLKTRGFVLNAKKQSINNQSQKLQNKEVTTILEQVQDSERTIIPEQLKSSEITTIPEQLQNSDTAIIPEKSQNSEVAIVPKKNKIKKVASTASKDLKLDTVKPRALSIEVLFAFDSEKLTSTAKKQLNPIGEALLSDQLQSISVLLEGHTDASGSDSYNLKLSERRALSVKIFLQSQYGISKDRLMIVGKGSRVLYDKENPTSGVNRRVVIAAQ